MNGVVKGMLIALTVVYLISPIDIMPACPVDDLLVVLLGLAASKELAA